MNSRTGIISTGCALMFSLGANAAVVFSNAITGTNPNTSNPYTTGQTFDVNISVSGIGRGSGITGSNANNRYNAFNWALSGLDATDFYTLTLTPNSGYEIDFTSFVYTAQASGTGPTSIAIRSSTDSFAGNIGTPSITGTTIDLSGGTYQNISSAIEFRVYAWGGSAAAGTFSINDFTFNGTVSAVPEPHEYAAVAGMGMIGFALWRRRASRKA